MARGVDETWGSLTLLSLSLTSSWCRNNLALPGSPSLVESPRGFLMAVCRQDEEDATFWWQASPPLGLLLHLSSRQISCGVLIVA